jgi:hypothetical protein
MTRGLEGRCSIQAELRAQSVRPGRAQMAGARRPQNGAEIAPAASKDNRRPQGRQERANGDGAGRRAVLQLPGACGVDGACGRAG